ncbi:MAG TPA: NAD(P)H-dependent oxidoreductase subunit E [Gemmatimonadota bacterium]|jgi:NADH-quinone oxidoreductase subunit E
MTAETEHSAGEMLDSFPGKLGNEVNDLVRRLGTGGAAILPVLEAIQRARGSLSDTTLQVAGRALGVRPADLKYLAAESGRFVIERPAAHVVVVCVHKHCRERGALALLEAVRQETGLTPGGTEPGAGLSLETVRCVGGCEVGPNVLVDGNWYAGVDPDGMRRILEALTVSRPAD